MIGLLAPFAIAAGEQRRAAGGLVHAFGQRLFRSEDGIIGRPQDAIEAPEHDERKDDLAVLRTGYFHRRSCIAARTRVLAMAIAACLGLVPFARALARTSRVFRKTFSSMAENAAVSEPL